MAIEVISKEKGVATLKCAFCRAEGVDPFGVLSELSLCPVCGGRKVVKMREPLRECAFCGGTGVHLETRLTCTACMGKGAASVKEPVVECPECRSSGVAHYRVDRVKSRLNLPCVVCGGKGVITSKKKG